MKHRLASQGSKERLFIKVINTTLLAPVRYKSDNALPRVDLHSVSCLSGPSGAGDVWSLSYRGKMLAWIAY